MRTCLETFYQDMTYTIAYHPYIPPLQTAQYLQMDMDLILYVIQKRCARKREEREKEREEEKEKQN